MSLPHLRYRVVGQDDYTLDIRVDPDGHYCIDCGDHTSHAPRQGRLERSVTDELARLVAVLGAPRDHPAPAETSGFVAELTVGEPPAGHRYHCWEGALEEEPALRALIKAMELI